MNPFSEKISCSQKIWEYHDAPHHNDETRTALISATANISSEPLPDFLIDFLHKRQITPEEAMHFLNPRLKHSLPDPHTFPDMEQAIIRIAQAINQGETIGIYSDYDVDGACSASLFIHYFRAMSAAHLFFIPNRITQGYGVNREGLESMIQKGATLILCCDCGTGTPQETLADLACDIIIFDHHQARPPYPDVAAFVNPARKDDENGHKKHAHEKICAAAICFIALIGINRYLRETQADTEPLPDLMDYLDLVALATIADVMPLVGLNRCFVTQGLKIMNQQKNIGLTTLNEKTRQGKTIDATEDISFGLAPYLNAGGRMGESLLATQLLSTDNPQNASDDTDRLMKLNAQRVTTQETCLELAKTSLDGNQQESDFILFGAQNLHIGVTGIVAGKLKDKYHIPCLIMSYDETGLGTGSARSVVGIDIATILQQALQQNILIRAGGHPMAGGFTLMQEHESRFRDFLSEMIPAQSNIEKARAPFLEIDVLCNIPSQHSSHVRGLEQLAPFGHGNGEPLFAIPDLRVKYLRFVGKKSNHLMVNCENQAGENLRGILFNAQEACAQALHHSFESGMRIHLAGYLRINRYQGQSRIEITIKDVMATHP